MPLLADLKDRLGLPASESQRAPVATLPTSALFPGIAAPTAASATPGSLAAMGTIPVPPKVMAGGRLTWDAPFLYGAGMPVILPPDGNVDEWRRLDLDADSIRFMPASRLLEVLADASPDVSRALWDFLRLMNPGWECVAYRPGTDTPLPKGQVVIDEWLRKLRKRYGSVDVPLGRLHFGAYLRGALFSELVLDDSATMAIDLATPDPWSARFRQGYDPTLGRVWLLGQFQRGEWIDLSARETIMYIPIDPAPASPYGRSPAGPSIFSALFLLGLLTDLRRVVSQQGYPRYDLAIALESLRKAAPPNVMQDPIQWKNWVDATIIEVQKAYSALEPDSAFVHTDVVIVNKPTGAVSADALAGIDPLIRALERELARALKTMPLLMGIIEGQSEANANRQWELQAAGIKAVQHLSDAQLSEWATLACEAQGVAAECRWRFSELRAAEKYRDAMTEGLTIDNATKLWMMGAIGQEELAQKTTGHAPDLPEPRLVPSNELPYSFVSGTTTGSPRADMEPAGAKSDKVSVENGETGGEAGESGASRAKKVFGIHWPELRLDWRLNGKPSGTPPPEAYKPVGTPLPYVPADVGYDEGDRRRITRDWDAAVPEGAGLLDARAQFIEPDMEGERVRDAADALRDVAKEVRELVVASKAPPSAPAKTRKIIERDDQGRMTGVVEVTE